MASNAENPDVSTAHARTDRQSAGRSVDTAPETLYLTKIAVQRARIDALETTVKRQEQDLQHVIDRYEHLLAARDHAGEPPTPTPAEYTCAADDEGEGENEDGDDRSSTVLAGTPVGDLLERLGHSL